MDVLNWGWNTLILKGKEAKKNFKFLLMQITSKYSTLSDNPDELVPYYLNEIKKTLKSIRE